MDERPTTNVLRRRGRWFRMLGLRVGWAVCVYTGSYLEMRKMNMTDICFGLYKCSIDQLRVFYPPESSPTRRHIWQEGHKDPALAYAGDHQHLWLLLLLP